MLEIARSSGLSRLKQSRTRSVGRLVTALAVVLVVTAAGCRRDEATVPASQPAPPDGTVIVRLGDAPISLEVVATDLSRQRGLMYRKSLPRDAGMVFVFAHPRVQRFWMKDTSIPLDIVYLDADAKIIAIKQMRPFDLQGTSSDGPARYAIELNEGTAERLRLKVGDRIELPPRVTSPPDLE